MPLISVIVPVYKVEPYLNRCIDSILNQTFNDFKLILVDDGSPDNCPQICDEYSKKDSRVVVIHKENGGLSSARNAGLDYVFSNSNFRYVTFIDSDDYIHPRYLELLSKAIQSGDYDLSVCGIIKDNNGVLSSFDKLDKKVIKGNEIYSGDNLHHCFSIMPAKLFSVDSIGKKRFINGVIHEDDMFMDEYYRKHIKLITIKEQLYYYFNSQGSIMNARDAFSYLCAIRELNRRIVLLKSYIFKHNRKDLLYFTNAIIGFYYKFLESNNAFKYKKELKRLLIKTYFILPLSKNSLSFRIKYLGYYTKLKS